MPCRGAVLAPFQLPVSQEGAGLQVALPMGNLVQPLLRAWPRPQAPAPPPPGPTSIGLEGEPNACREVRWVRAALLPRVIRIRFLLSRCFFSLGPIPWLPGKWYDDLGLEPKEHRRFLAGWEWVGANPLRTKNTVCCAHVAERVCTCLPWARAYQETEGAANPHGGEAAGCVVERIHGWEFYERAGTHWQWNQDTWAVETIGAKSVVTSKAGIWDFLSLSFLTCVG